MPRISETEESPKVRILNICIYNIHVDMYLFIMESLSQNIIVALQEIFDKADISNTGSLTIPEYLDLCRNYNIEVTEDDFATIESLAENNGGGLSKNDFIIFVRQTNMYTHFDTLDPESDQHWNEKIEHAWKLFDKVRIDESFLYH